MKRKLLRALVFIAIGCLLFGWFVKAFRFESGKPFWAYYTLPENTVDVLFVGSSHVYRNIDPAALYDQSGITAYALGSPSQPLWITYYYLKEALKTQKPKVVFIECYKASIEEDYSDAATTVKALIPLRFSKDYLQMVEASVPSEENRLDYILQFPWYHSRYNELSWRSLLPGRESAFYRNFMGAIFYENSESHPIPAGVNEITHRLPITDKNLMYLGKIVELARSEGVTPVFLLTPFYEWAIDFQPYYNTLANYAEAQGVPLINGNLMYAELGLDGAQDFARGNHLSFSGTQKLMRWLNGYLQEHYDLADHRGDPKYERWAINAEDIRQGEGRTDED